ncbi:hypothetical protein AVEN_136996-1 [Araneus ventricosus]|uniref:Uncharacterized protein n=1 Tax=Araneus ventricosus TaxID=182803 RepID=A0A4Y2NCD9_ARAVE|nr:hypothetical protein AVEN_136996-1 [Araneus ventricosus]
MLGVDKHLEKTQKMADFRKKAILKRSQQMKTPYLAAALDRTKVSDRKAVFVVAEMARSSGYEVDEITLSRSYIRRKRMKLRSNMFHQLKTEFQEQDAKLTVHWDGELLQNLTGKEKVDTLPVIVSGKSVHQLLTVPKFASGTGENQAVAVYAALQFWGLADKVSAMCFDTTSVNTGQINGTCVLLEQKMNKKLLYLACRHHIVELIISAVFNKCMGFSSAPDVLLFKRFQAYWEFIDKNKYETGINNDILAKVADIKDDRIQFAEKLLHYSHSR